MTQATAGHELRRHLQQHAADIVFGSLSGGFFSSPTDTAGHAAYQAGTFSIGSARSRYQATGIFAGQR